MSLLSSGGAFNPTDLIKQFQTAQQKQFDQLVSTIKDLGAQTTGTFDDALGRLSGLGDTARIRAERGGQQALAAGRQDLRQSGLSNTTLTPNLGRAVQQDVELQQQGIDEQVGFQQSGLLAQRAGVETQIGGLLAGAISGAQPDLGLFASLLQAAAAAGNPNQKTTASIGPGSVGGEGLLRAPTGGGRSSSGGGGGGGGPAGGSGGGGGGAGNTQGARVITRASAGLGSRNPNDFGTLPRPRSSGGAGSPGPANNGIGRMLFARGSEFSFA